MIVIGLNAFHGDSAACIIRDGVLVAAVEEERLRRVKHWAGFPSESIRYCLRAAGIGLSDVDRVAVNQSSTANLGARLRYLAAHPPGVSVIRDRLRNRVARGGVRAQLARAFPGETFRGDIKGVEHHLAHLASAVAAGSADDAAVMSVDGFGDFASAAWGHVREGRISVAHRVFFPHSLGIFYQALTQYLGFPAYGDEYKVMGLAAYGSARMIPALRPLVHLLDDGGYSLSLEYFRHHTERVAYRWDGGTPAVDSLFSAALVELLGPPRKPDDPIEQRHRDLAFAAQAVYEEAFFHALRAAHAAHPSRQLALAGGCAMNSLANGRITRETPFHEVIIPAAAGDAGGAVGAALIASGLSGVEDGTSAYLGPSFEASEIERLLHANRERLSQCGCVVEQVSDERRLASETAMALSEGEVIGWFAGRLEWGPRALGNRSIIADPRRRDLTELLNSRIKRREPFRPFAPAVLRERMADWFDGDADVPFMSAVSPVRADKRDRIPGVTHADGTARLQTVTAANNSRWYNLIAEFDHLTGVPMIVNTSFNENEPIVCTPGEALDCFLRTGLDRLVLENWVVRRPRP